METTAILSANKVAIMLENNFDKEVEKNPILTGMFFNLDKINAKEKILTASIYKVDGDDTEKKYGEIKARYDEQKSSYLFEYSSVEFSLKNSEIDNILKNNDFYSKMLDSSTKEIEEKKDKIGIFKLFDGKSYGIRAIIDGEQLPTKRMSFEDTKAFFEKQVSKEELAKKYLLPTPTIGRLSWLGPDGTVVETLEYKDKEHYINTIRRELNANPSIVIIETLSKDPEINKSVDDLKYGLYGEENPHDIDYYKNKEGDEKENNKKQQKDSDITRQKGNSEQISASIFKMMNGRSYAIRANINGEQFSAKRLNKKDINDFFNKKVSKEELACKYFDQNNNKRENTLKR